MLSQLGLKRRKAVGHLGRGKNWSVAELNEADTEAGEVCVASPSAQDFERSDESARVTTSSATEAVGVTKDEDNITLGAANCLSGFASASSERALVIQSTSRGSGVITTVLGEAASDGGTALPDASRYCTTEQSVGAVEGAISVDASARRLRGVPLAGTLSVARGFVTPLQARSLSANSSPGATTIQEARAASRFLAELGSAPLSGSGCSVDRHNSATRVVGAGRCAVGLALAIGARFSGGDPVAVGIGDTVHFLVRIALGDLAESWVGIKTPSAVVSRAISHSGGTTWGLGALRAVDLEGVPSTLGVGGA